MPLPKKITEKTFFPSFGILTMKILALAICDTRQKTIQYLDISFLAADPLITVSLSLDGISNIIYPQERNMTTAGYR